MHFSCSISLFYHRFCHPSVLHFIQALTSNTISKQAVNIFYLSLFFVYSHKYKTLRYHFCIRILCCQFVVEVPHAELGHLGTCESLPSCRHSVFTMKTFTCGAQDLAWALVILDFCGACTSSYKLVQAQTSHVPVS